MILGLAELQSVGLRLRVNAGVALEINHPRWGTQRRILASTCETRNFIQAAGWPVSPGVSEQTSPATQQTPAASDALFSMWLDECVLEFIEVLPINDIDRHLSCR